MKKKNASPRREKNDNETTLTSRPWEAREDLLSACARVFLFSLGRTRGDRRPYEGHWRCSGEDDSSDHLRR